MIRSNDNGKHFATVEIPSPVSLNDNSGINPAVTITPSYVGSVHDFPISDPKSDGTVVTYTATDNAGLTASCSFNIKVKGEALGGTRGEGYSHMLAIRVCAAGEGMVFKPFGLV